MILIDVDLYNNIRVEIIETLGLAVSYRVMQLSQFSVSSDFEPLSENTKNVFKCLKMSYVAH